MKGKTKPIIFSQTFLLGAGSLALISQQLEPLPPAMIWPVTAIVCSLIIARGLADFGKYGNSGTHYVPTFKPVDPNKPEIVSK